MTEPISQREHLFEFAYLALTLAHGVDDHLSAFELESLADRLYRHHAGWSQREVQDVVQEALRAYSLAPDRWERAREACHRLATQLDVRQRQQALDDLLQIARADGIVHDAERQFVAKIAAFWQARGARVPADWTLLHDLAYLYVALALGADEDLSEHEVQQIRQSIAAGPLAPADPERVAMVLQETLGFYTRHADPSTREAVTERLRDALTAEQRTDVLARLIALANVDDRFLDAEEDLLNGLAMTWDVDAGVLYDPPDEDAR